MDTKRIAAIKERVKNARALGDWPAWAYSLAFHDVPDLLAEVERLRRELIDKSALLTETQAESPAAGEE